VRGAGLKEFIGRVPNPGLRNTFSQVKVGEKEVSNGKLKGRSGGARGCDYAVPEVGASLRKPR